MPSCDRGRDGHPPAVAGPARADITLVNQASLVLQFVIKPQTGPGGLAWVGSLSRCAAASVPPGGTLTVPRPQSCGERANVTADTGMGGSNSAGTGGGILNDPTGTIGNVPKPAPTCSIEDISWTDGRVTVSGNSDFLIRN